MSPNKSHPSPTAPSASPPKRGSAPVDDSPYKVGVELADVTPMAGGSGSASRPRASGSTTNQAPRSMCFMVENCKWCRPEAQTQGELGRVPKSEEQDGQEEESPAVNALRECLETLERDRLRQTEAGMHADRYPRLVQRCLNMCGKAV